MRISVPIGASILFLSITALASAADDPLMEQAQSLFQPIPLQAPAIKGVTATTAMVALGKALYFDPRLSQSDNISCNTCRQIGLGGAAPSALHVRLIVALMRSQIAPAQTIGTVKRRKLQ